MMITYIEFDEPWGEIRSDDGTVHTISQTIRLLKSDVIAWQMSMYRMTGQPKYESEQEALDDFMIVHWARLVEAP